MATPDSSTPPPSPAQPPLPAAALWACVLAALFVPGVGSLLYSYVFIGQPIGKAVMIATKIFTLIGPLVAVLAVERVRPPPLRDWRIAHHLRAIPLGLLIGGLIVGVTALLWSASPLGDYVRGFAEPIARQTRDLGFAESRTRYIILTTLLSVVHSLLEEYYWRWYVYGRMTRLVRPGLAHGIAAVGFMLHHFVILSKYFPPVATLAFGLLVGVGGLIWSWQMTHQRSLAGAWVSHMLVDGILMFIGYQLIFN